MKKQLRTKSHRLPLKRKYTILKKIKEHKRKVKRDLKRHPEKKRKPRTDRGIPNSCPFKEEILQDMENLKKLKEKEHAAKRAEILEKRKEMREAKLAEKRGLSMEKLAKDAQVRDNMFENKENETEEPRPDSLNDNSAKAYFKEFRKVIEAADVILEVLDARDPIGTRCKTVEQAVFDSGTNKRLVLVLNKADLVPKDNLTQWLKYLRNELPAVAFKASTQIQSHKLGRGRKKFLHGKEEDIKTSKCLGADTLMTLLGNYARNKGIKTAIRVGVVGLPNVGKSSIINSLKRSKSCNVGAVPGVTKAMQEVALDSKIMLLDSPGIVMATGDASDTTVALRNALRIDSIEDAIAPLEVILKRTGKDYMMIQYGLANFQTTREFLCLLAKRIGRLKKGAVPDVHAAAKKILHDWNTGKIKYFTCPPEDFTPTTHLSATIVTEMAKEFSLDDIEFQSKETEDMEQLPFIKPSSTVAIETFGICEGESGQQMDCDDGPTNSAVQKTVEVKVDKPTPNSKLSKKDKLKKSEVAKKKINPESLLPGNQKSNRMKRLEMKKAKKNQARREKLGESLAIGMEAAFAGLGGM